MEVKQGRVISATKPILEKAIQDLFSKGFSGDILVATDLGCACGPNTLSVVSTIINTVEKITQEWKQQAPEIKVFLNDLPGNDFNSIFRGLPAFYREMVADRKNDALPCFIAGVPGSFHGRLFPKKSLHLVPPELYDKEGMPLNKGRMYVSGTSPPLVFKAYLEQFRKDFHSFLRSRSEEVQTNGVMVLVLAGRSRADLWTEESNEPWELLSEILSTMVLEGVVSEEEVDSFDVPFYTPSVEETWEIIEKEGSFSIERLETFGLEAPACIPGEMRAKNIRCFTEPLIVSHFGQHISDHLFHKLTLAVVQDPERHNFGLPSNIVAVLWKK
ncbi:hypothetical protein ACLOJK_012451 [Asimina triloba]